jgi:hypothetical protein
MLAFASALGERVSLTSSSGGALLGGALMGVVAALTAIGDVSTPVVVQTASHEPAGMVMQINTGPMSSIPSFFSVFSPATPTALGEWSGNLTVVPSGTGLRISYPTNLSGGYSPVRFGMSIRSAGTGWYYQRMRVRLPAGWTAGGNVAVKLFEPHTRQAGSGRGAEENHVVTVVPISSPQQAFLQLTLQGPNGHFANLGPQPAGNRAANLGDGVWHLIEVLFTPESSPGAGDGAYQAWVDGTQVANYAKVLWLAPGNPVGWPYLLFDPTYGGGRHNPPYPVYWEFDQLYVSTR